MTSRKNIQSDLIGVIASGLCAVHCIITPFLFLAQSCSTTSCCGSTPSWWSSIDYLFIGITFFAVFHSGKNSSKPWIKYALFSIWGLLSILVLNGKFNLLNISEWWKYLTAFGLISLHLYNLKFCRCSEESCCVVA
jgi:MerC mercury resistance protein.